MSRRPCSLADGVEQAPGKSMEENELKGVEALGYTRFTIRRMPFSWTSSCGRDGGMEDAQGRT